MDFLSTTATSLFSVVVTNYDQSQTESVKQLIKNIELP